jgi:phage-related protein
MNRREFVGHLTVGPAALALCSGFIAATIASLEGCNAGSVWTQIQTWVPVGISAFEQILILVAPLAAPGIDVIAEAVKAGFSVLAGAISQYINAPAADKVTLLQKVQLAFQDVSQNLQAFLTAINVAGTNPIVKVVLGLVSIILSTIASFMSQIGPTPAPVALRAAGTQVDVVPVKRSLKQFKADFNAALVAAGHPELRVN